MFWEGSVDDMDQAGYGFGKFTDVVAISRCKATGVSTRRRQLLFSTSDFIIAVPYERQCKKTQFCIQRKKVQAIAISKT